MLPAFSSFELDVLYALIALHEGPARLPAAAKAPHSRRPFGGFCGDCFAAFEGTLDRSKRWTLISSSANTLRLFYNKAALPHLDMPREQFKSMCKDIKERLLFVSNFIIKLEEEKLIIPEYKTPYYIQPTHEQTLPWRVYNEFFPNEAPPILYVKSLNPVPEKKLYELLEARRMKKSA